VNGPRIAVVALALLSLAAPAAALAQGRPDPAVLLAAQRDAMTRLAMMDGEWRGTAWNVSPSGEKHTLTQTERVGPFLDGAIRVVEGRGYGADGKVAFNAFGVISYKPDTKAYSIRSHAMGNAGDFALTPTADGFTWEIPAGPMTIRYTATIKDGVWKEVGDRIAPGKEPVRFFEMELKRLGDSSWPAAGAVPQK
jgi:hypothetical protein